jgi:hypothetical protein
MNTMLCSILALTLSYAGCASPDDSSARSPYAMQTESSVRGLSAQEVDDLLQGRGMGLARAAELSGYPGPRHVLDLAADLGLMPAQRTAAEAIFGRMQEAAKTLGAQIVEHEQQLGKAFIDRSVEADSMNQHVAHIATLQGKLRAVHLQAHLELTAQLDHAQITKYNELRGYDVAALPSQPGHSHQHGAM